MNDVAIKKHLVLIYYSNKSCYDCFGTLNDFFAADSSWKMLYVIEKTNSAMLNVEIKRKLMKKGISDVAIYFIPEMTNTVSPYVDLLWKASRKRLPYSQIFDSEKDFSISETFKAALEDMK